MPKLYWNYCFQQILYLEQTFFVRSIQQIQAVVEAEVEAEVKREMEVMEEKMEEVTVVEVNKGSFFQKELIHLLYPQRYKPNHIHELEILNFGGF